MPQKNGFTLLELLIVVLIIAILAALILPRMMAQTERAVISEAQQMLGSLRRAQLVRQDLDDVNQYKPVNDDVATWRVLGLERPPDGGSFHYLCAGDADVHCVARRVGGAFAGSTVTMAMDTGRFSCDGEYMTAEGGNNTTTSHIGCAPKR